MKMLRYLVYTDDLGGFYVGASYSCAMFHVDPMRAKLYASPKSAEKAQEYIKSQQYATLEPGPWEEKPLPNTRVVVATLEVKV